MMLRSGVPKNTAIGQHRVLNKKSGAPKIPSLKDFVSKRDYIGALTFLEFNFQETEESSEVYKLLWIAYCSFHLGDHERAQAAFIELLSGSENVEDSPKEVTLYLACVYYYMQMYKEAEEAAMKGPDCSLKNRILFHVSQKVNNEEKNEMVYRQRLTPGSEQDQLSLASMHYQRGRYQEAIDVCKRLLVENRDNLALNVYVAMCYFKLDYYDVSLEILSVYLQTFPESAIAVNLKACNHFRLYNGKAAEEELKVLGNFTQITITNHLIRHNMAVFSNGERALQNFPPLMDILPEARLNLGIHYLKRGLVEEADALLKNLDPSTPQECVLKAVVHATIGQKSGNSVALRTAQTLFQAVGSSPSECDTIPGRQCMASCFFLLKQFDDVNIYLQSVKSYMYNDDAFNWNYGVSLTLTGNYKSAQETLLLVQDPKYKHEFCYVSCLSRCYIMNGRPEKAWNLYLQMDNTAMESLHLLHLIANDSYRMGHFLYAARAFHVLEKISDDADLEFWEGKRGACVGVFQRVIAAKERDEEVLFRAAGYEELFKEVIVIMNTTSNPQAEFIVKMMKRWAKENNLKIS